jgi:hypothetical protein
MNFWTQLNRVLHSRKFWALVAALLATVGTFASGQISGWEALQAIIAALAVYSTGVAIEDAGRGRVV